MHIILQISINGLTRFVTYPEVLMKRPLVAQCTCAFISLLCIAHKLIDFLLLCSLNVVGGNEQSAANYL